MSADAPEFDPYAVLGVGPDATREEVEAAWRRALRATHPDCNPSDRQDDRRVREVLRAGRILRDPARRRAWDRVHRPPAPEHRQRRPTWTGLAWDGGRPQRDTDHVPGRVDIVHRKG